MNHGESYVEGIRAGYLIGFGARLHRLILMWRHQPPSARRALDLGNGG